MIQTSAIQTPFAADAPERVVLDVDLPTAGLVVLTDAAYPGWQATLDGHPVEIQRVDGLFRGVPAPAGKHQLEFAFRPASLAIGAAISGFTALVLIALVGLRLSSRLGPHGESPGRTD